MTSDDLLEMYSVTADDSILSPPTGSESSVVTTSGSPSVIPGKVSKSNIVYSIYFTCMTI